MALECLQYLQCGLELFADLCSMGNPNLLVDTQGGLETHEVHTVEGG